MNNSDEFLVIKALLCPMCLEVYEGRLAKAEEVEEENAGRQAKDIYQLERKAQAMELCIQNTLTPALRKACWALVASVQREAEYRAQQSASDWTEQGMLYNILMAESWKAAQSYNPAKSKFSTWVFRPWSFSIKEFQRVKRLQTASLSAPVDDSDNDPDNQSTLQDQIEDPKSPSPVDCLQSKELANWADSTLEAQPLLKVMIDDACQQYEWLCPFCRRAVRQQFLCVEAAKGKGNRDPIHSGKDVFARRSFFLNTL